MTQIFLSKFIISMSIWSKKFFNIDSCRHTVFNIIILYISFSYKLYDEYMPVAVYDGCGSLAFVYWLRLKQFVVPIYDSDSLGAIWGMGMLSSCICSTLVSVCAMKGIPIGPLAQWEKDLTYYLTPFFCLVNCDMYYLRSACRGKDLPPGRILYIHTSMDDVIASTVLSKL